MAQWSLLDDFDRQTFFGSNFRKFPKYLGGCCSFLALKEYHVITRLGALKKAIYRPESHHRDSSSFSPCFLNSSPKCYQDRLSN